MIMYKSNQSYMNVLWKLLISIDNMLRELTVLVQT